MNGSINLAAEYLRLSMGVFLLIPTRCPTTRLPSRCYPIVTATLRIRIRSSLLFTQCMSHCLHNMWSFANGPLLLNISTLTGSSRTKVIWIPGSPSSQSARLLQLHGRPTNTKRGVHKHSTTQVVRLASLRRPTFSMV